MSLLLSGGMNLSGGIALSGGSGGGGSWATINPSTASSQLTVSGNELSISGDLSSSTGFAMSTGAKTVLSTGSYSFEVVVDRTGGTDPYFYAGIAGLQNFQNSVWPINNQSGFNLGYGWGFGPGSPSPRLWAFDSVAQAFWDPTTYVSDNNVLGFVVDFTNSATGVNLGFYLNGTLITAYDTNFTSVPGGQVGIILGWRFTSYNSPTTGSKITLRTDPSTFSYGGNYTNQNGWSS